MLLLRHRTLHPQHTVWLQVAQTFHSGIMNSTKQFSEQFKEVLAQTTQHIGQLQKVDIVIEHKAHNTSHRLL
jgi:hypothetical protein